MNQRCSTVSWNFLSEQGASAALNRTFAASLLLNAAAAGPKSYVNLTLSRHLVLDDRHQAGTCLQPLWQESLWICKWGTSQISKLLALWTAFAKISNIDFTVHWYLSLNLVILTYCIKMGAIWDSVSPFDFSSWGPGSLDYSPWAEMDFRQFQKWIPVLRGS